MEMEQDYNYNLYKEVTFIKETIDVEIDLLRSLFEVLLSKKLKITIDHETGLQVYKLEQITGKLPVVNEKGFYDILSLVEGFVSKHSILSNINSTKDANNLLVEFTERLGDMLFMNMREYAPAHLTTLSDKEFEVIFNATTPRVRFALYRAVGGLERDTIRKNFSVSQNEVVNKNVEEQQRKKIFGFI